SELDAQGVVTLGILRDHGELPPGTDAAGDGVDLLHRDFGRGPALHAVAGALLGQRHHEPHHHLVAEGVREAGQGQEQRQATTEEQTISLHDTSSLPVLVMTRTSGPTTPSGPGEPASPPFPRGLTVNQATVASFGFHQRRRLSVSLPRMPWGRKIMTRMTM